MGTISKIKLSESTQGNPIQISATGSPGTTIHVTGSSATDVDEVWIYATNTSSASTNLTIEYGGTGTGSQIILSVPSRSGLSLVVTGSILLGDGSTVSTISAYAATGGAINILGYVNRIEQ